MGLIVALVLAPVLIALLLIVFRSERTRTPITIAGAVVVSVLTIAACVTYLGAGTMEFSVPEQFRGPIGYMMLAIDIIVCAYIIFRSVVSRQKVALILALVQLALVLYLDLGPAHGMEVANQLYVDTLSLIMIFVIGIVGSGIGVYAIGYMRDYTSEHSDVSDNRPVFFAIVFGFLGAMMLLVTTNDLRWLLTAWEVTTVCSFALIGYSRDEVAVGNAFLQVRLNLVGGIAMTLGIIVTAVTIQSVSLDVLIVEASYNPALSLAITLLVIASLIKSAQMPVHRWLLGAMVAPTPTSALLHSSTMVKAGCFLLIKMAPALGSNAPGFLAMTVGGGTFFLCAVCAISQRNAKRVLAYSTISNLGLIAACAGTGLPQGVWAAIFLLVFHAFAKSLMFCCVGTAEHRIESRDIEEMDLLFERLPILTRSMLVGAMIMFIAPFGMLVAKWASLTAFLDAHNLVVVVAICFGSAATFFFWAKWMGKLVANTSTRDSIEKGIHPTEWVFIHVMSALSALSCVMIPVVSRYIVMPYLDTIWPSYASSPVVFGDLVVMGVMSAAVLIVVISLPRRQDKVAPIYLAGLGLDPVDRTYRDSFDHARSATQSNLYLDDMFPELTYDRVAVILGVILMVGGLCWSLFATMQTVAAYGVMPL